MLSKRFQKQLIKEIARLAIKRATSQARVKIASDEVADVNVEIERLKTQLGFDPEKELPLPAVPASSEGEAETDLTPPPFLQRKQA